MYRCFRLYKLPLLVCVIVFFFLLGFVKNEPAIEVSEPADRGIFLPIIMYHSVLKNESRLGEYVVSPDTLEADLKYLSEHGYSAVLPEDLVEYVYDGVPLPEKPVMITFDDGHVNNMTYALPMLEKYEMKAVISVVGSFSEKYSKEDDHNPAYAYCTWEDIRVLSESPYIEIGNHTYDMHRTDRRKGCQKLRSESGEEYSRVLYEDIGKLQSLLAEKSGCTPTAFAYPFGYLCKESVPILQEMGFKVTMNCCEKPNYITRSPNTLYGLNRYNRPSGISTEKFMEKVLAE